MSFETDATENHLVAALPDADRQRWLARLEPVALPLGRVLCEAGHIPDYVFFPTSAIVSLFHMLHDGAAAEIAMVGREGVVGIASFMGSESSPVQSVVSSAGQGLRLKACWIKDEFEHHAPVKHLMLRYTQALMAQMSQTAVCNRHHTIEQQLCRYLLHCMDRLQGNELAMTHELISNMLGVRRGGVTEAALKLQMAGLIRYHKGHITVLDRGGLERHSCECHAVVKREYDRLLPDLVAA